MTGLTPNDLTNTDGYNHVNCTNSTCDCRSRTVDLGLAVGRSYEIVVFHAERHPSEANFQLTVSGFTTRRSRCVH